MKHVFFRNFALDMIKRLLFYALLLLSLPTAAQTEVVYADDSNTSDSLVLTVPLQQLVEQRLDVLIDDSLFETSQLGLMVWDLTDDTLLYTRNTRQLMRPASTMKLLTAITALDDLGTDYKFKTSLYYNGTISRGTLKGDLLCVGGMDPMFDDADMKAFVQSLKNAGVKSFSGRIVCDVSMKVTDKWGEGWCWDDDNPTLSPLLYNRKADFGEQFIRAMRAARLTVNATIVTGTLPRTASLLCTRTHTIDEVLTETMKESNNLFAESVFYQVAANRHRPGKADDACKVELKLFEKIGLDGERYRLADGSGLSLYNYLTPEAQVMLLRYVWQHPDIYNHLLPTLPIAGVDGTLKKRMHDTFAQGNVQAKTGTVTAVSALSGYCTAANGHRLCFCIMNQGIRRAAEGRNFQDRVCNALCQP